MRSKWAVPVIFSILILGGLGYSQHAFANPLVVSHVDGPDCDPLFVDDFVDELGWSTGITFFPGPFLPDEAMNSTTRSFVPFTACPTSTVPPAGFPVTIEITNFSGDDWPLVWYVADSDTLISNVDGFVDGSPAFQIDSSDPTCGFTNGLANTPLFFESFQPAGFGNCIFEAGETWRFIIDGYFNPILGPELFDSLGVAGASFGAPPSTGSIIVTDFGFEVGGTEIPIDTTTLLLAGVQSISMWMIPVVAAVVVIGVFVIKRRQ